MANVIKVQQAPKKKTAPEDLLATFCYHYQQYTFAQARKLPYKRIVQMLKVANKEHAIVMIELVQIASAPHAKQGAVQSLLNKYHAIINE